VLAINPGDAHDGRSGAAGGFAYRMLYITPERMRSIAGDFATRTPLVRDRTLACAVDDAWRAMHHDPRTLAADELLERALVQLVSSHGGLAPCVSSRLDQAALTRVREHLHAHLGDRVRLGELAALASMSRFQLTRQSSARTACRCTRITCTCVCSKRSGGCATARASRPSRRSSASAIRVISIAVSKERSA